MGVLDKVLRVITELENSIDDVLTAGNKILDIIETKGPQIEAFVDRAERVISDAGDIVS